MFDVESLTLEEKLTLLTGYDGLSAGNLPQKGVAKIQMTDGPYGVKTDDGSVICLPNTCLTACSFDKDVLYEIGKIVGWQCSQKAVNLLLAPAMNIKRNPLCGRNFEYYSEDPLVTGNLAVSYINGVRESGTLVCAKHFACNNQETARWTQNSVVDDDTLRNIYLKAFEIVVKNANPDSIMACYNRINDVYGCENEYLLTEILRKEWGYSGLVMSDWCAVNDLVSAFNNGLNLEMPSNALITVPILKQALEKGEISIGKINQSVSKVIELAQKISAKKVDILSNDALRKLTGECFVLLKNENVLPLNPKEKILVVGSGAVVPRIQGGGCAKLKTNVTLVPLEEMRKYANCDFANFSDKEKLSNAQNYDKTVVFLTMSDECDSEAFDRKDLDFPKEQLDCVNYLVNKNVSVITVLVNGSAVVLPFESKVKGILETYYAGSLGGGAIADVLFGKTTPSGRLAESFLLDYQDIGSKDNFAKDGDVVYLEGQFVGYRRYVSCGIKTQYPFGYGLSYCQYEYSQFELIENNSYDYTLKFNVENKSNEYDGKEVVQIYLKTDCEFIPKMQLIAFDCFNVAKNGVIAVETRLNSDCFSYYRRGKKVKFEGDFSICVAKDCENVIKEFKINLSKEERFDYNTTLGRLLSDDKYRQITLSYMQPYINYWAFGDCDSKLDFEKDYFLKNSVYNMPVRAFTYFSQGKFDYEKVDEFIKKLKEISKVKL